MKAAVLYCIFNRLDVVKETFQSIREYKPSKLYIASDGPREGKEGEFELVQSVRNYVLEHIDWDCKVNTLFRDKNLGCRNQMIGAIRWFFDNEPMGIIIEDDIKASPQFFDFCNILLDKYKDNKKVLNIHGTRLSNIEYKYDYSFCHESEIWGWASWADRFNDVDFSLSDWKQFRDEKRLDKILNNEFAVKFWSSVFNYWYNSNTNSSWAVSLLFDNFKKGEHGCVSIAPASKNLVTNIGYDGVHFSKDCAGELGWEIDYLDTSNLRHPNSLETDKELLDRYYENLCSKEANKVYSRCKHTRFVYYLLQYLKLASTFLKLVITPKSNNVLYKRRFTRLVLIRDNITLAKYYYDVLEKNK